MIALVGPKKWKNLDFFSLGEIFIGNGMGKWGGEINPNTFGNMAHPTAPLSNSIKKQLKLKCIKLEANLFILASTFHFSEA